MKIQLTDESGEYWEEPFPKHIFRTVYESLAKRGYDVPSVDKYEVPNDADGPVNGAGILPAFMVGADNDIPGLIRTGVAFPFNLESRLDTNVQKSQKNHATKHFIKAQMSIPEAIEELHNRGKFALSIEKLTPLSQGFRCNT